MSADLADLILGLEHPNPQIRSSSAEALGKLGESAVVAIPRLIALLGDREMGGAVVCALGGLALSIRSVATALAHALLSGPQGIRCQIPLVFDYTFTMALPFAPRRPAWLLDALRESILALKCAIVLEENAAIRGLIAMNLGRVAACLPGQDVQLEVVPLLAALLDWGDGSVGQGAAIGLGELGSKASSAVPVLMHTMKTHRRPAAREAARDALKSITGRAFAQSEQVPACTRYTCPRCNGQRGFVYSAFGREFACPLCAGTGIVYR